MENDKAPPRNSLALPLRHLCISTEQLPTIFMCEWTVILKSFSSSRYIEIACSAFAFTNNIILNLLIHVPLNTWASQVVQW